MLRFAPFLLVLCLASVAGVPAAGAQSVQTASESATAPRAYGELLGGLYFPDQSTPDDGSIWGVRGGYRWHHAAVEVSVDRFEGTVSTGHGGFDARFTSVALSGLWIPNPGGRPEVLLHGGLGRTDVEHDGSGRTLGGRRSAEDSVFARAGAGLSFALTDRVYIRPQAEARWFERGDDTIDLAATVALGWRF